MSVENTLNERATRYGDFSDHARVAQGIKDAMQHHPKWSSLSPDKKEALEMIGHKMARIVNGDPEYKDNWHDIGGYAKLAEDRCKS
jgi:hypothetical protein